MALKELIKMNLNTYLADFYSVFMKDLLGQALLDYQDGNYTEDLLTETNISEEDELPLSYFFRSFTEMPLLEQNALNLCKGKILDIGCGAGSHALYLQENQRSVHAIDISEGAIEVCKKRGVKEARCIDIMNISEEKYDTLLLLMNGTGIFENVNKVSSYLQKLKSLLQPNGQILVDSSDLQYMYDSNEDGAIWVPSDHYYGELTFTMKYKGETTTPFPWLYLDETLFEKLCTENELQFEIISRGDNFDYLARLTVVENNLAGSTHSF